MFAPEMYQLLDFGEGRRLEQFGPWRLDRPCPTVERIDVADPGAWIRAHARFDRTGENEGQWDLAREVPERWTINYGQLAFELKRTPFGHLGLFPEQAANWEWITQNLRKAGRPMKVLNLFAYTGGSTLAAATAGAEVVHVDAAENVAAWARRNAELSGLAEASIRWIAEDAMKFVRRELQRGARYDAVILDPPTYGHGPQGEVWRLSKHLLRLMAMCGDLTARGRRFILVTCHTPKIRPQRLKDMLLDALAEPDADKVTAARMTLRAVDGRELPSGIVARWEARG